VIYQHFLREQVVEFPLERVFAFFSDAANLEALTPPFLRFRIATPLPIAMSVGTRIDYELSLFGVPLRWRSHIAVWEPPARFVDVQERGPYAHWRHLHEFEALGPSRTMIRDRVDYALPLGPLGALADRALVRRTLRRIFDYRSAAIAALLAR
jgi:ligand-binding SRPBCC domain-containing protein